MSLLSIETITEIMCLVKLIPKGNFKHFAAPESLLNNNVLDFKWKTFLTAGSRESTASCGDAPKIYSWCSTGSNIIPNLISNFLKPAINSLTDRCLSFNRESTTNASALEHMECNVNTVPYICEPKCDTPTCPSSCAKNVRQ
jgi:hypothetical protein